jgi:hypothetical protein
MPENAAINARQLHRTPAGVAMPYYRPAKKIFLFVHNKNVTNPPAHAFFGSSARAPPAQHGTNFIKVFSHT